MSHPIDSSSDRSQPDGLGSVPHTATGVGNVSEATPAHPESTPSNRVNVLVHGRPAELDQALANAMGQNIDWFQAHKSDILIQHPDWREKFLVVSSRTPSKILAVSESRDMAIDAALRSPELAELARRVNLPTDMLATVVTLCDF